ncbi:MAG: chemotaxis protein CheX [Thermodesulfobacterium geofontis]|uniref:Chemotaxis protein CheX n=1 Tax=Thermodesulfobacterium geofontis TaxID=1295609 RepID=A0A2N7PQE4_9BACT|nr:MAG: chemotaxis protein CheX [Thermodesulfobacterium geofontis]PMP94638.1 MAG: chemotaxis protein CheX [Thermodesulfobacterium geofontis]
MQASSVSEYIKKAVEEVVGTYLSKKPILKDTKVKRENTGLKDISVVIGLASEKLEGVFIVSYDKRIIFDFMKNVLGEETNEINKDVIDASGELTNQICGVFRREFEKTGITLQGSTPSIVTGENHKIEIPSKIPRMVFLYQVDENKDLMIEFGLIKK